MVAQVQRRRVQRHEVVDNMRRRAVQFVCGVFALALAVIVPATTAGALTFGDCIAAGGHVLSSKGSGGHWEHVCMGGGLHGVMLDD